MSTETWSANWEKVRELSSGGQGTTIEVRRRGSVSDRGVLKVLNDDSNSQARARMAREAINLELLAQNRIKVPRLIEHNTQLHSDLSIQLYIVMEYIDGQTLENAVKVSNGKLPLQDSIAVALDLCHTIAAMHAQDVLHRDLKPSNLIVRSMTPVDVVVVDLGLSFDGTGNQDTVTHMGETMKNEMLALPETTLPTLGRESRRDPRSDLTNIVAVFYYCLTGSMPGMLSDHRDLAPHRRPGLTMQEVLSDDAKATVGFTF